MAVIRDDRACSSGCSIGHQEQCFIFGLKRWLSPRDLVAGYTEHTFSSHITNILEFANNGYSGSLALVDSNLAMIQILGMVHITNLH